MRKLEYVCDIRLINHTKMLQDGWKEPKKEDLPSPKSSKKVLLIVNKHSKKDATVKHGWWMPRNGYKTGYFVVNKHTVIKNKDILYFKDFNMIITTEEAL